MAGGVRPDERGEPSWGGRFRWWFFTKNNVRTGVIWIVASYLFFFAAGLLALQMRLELARPQADLVDAEGYAELFTLHGTFMIFFFAVPLFFGFAAALLPRALGGDNVAFPRLNSLDMWLIVAGGLTLEVGYFLGQRPMAGWTGYAPLSLEAYSPGHGMDWWVWAIFLETFGTMLAGVNVLATILRKRRAGLALRRMPLFAWSMLFASLLVVVATPFLLTALGLLFLDRNFGTAFFAAGDVRSLLLWQDLFWFYSHPATYVMLLPAVGIVSLIVARFSGRPIFSYGLVIAGMAGVWVFSYLVWWHHMFTTGMHLLPRVFASVNTWAVSVFSGVIVFSWLASMWRGRIRLTTPMLWALGVVAMFTIGGADGVFLAFVPLDLYLHDTYWLVAHFHYIIFAATVLGSIAAIYYWFPAVLGRQLDERLGQWHFWLTLVGMNVTFFPMHNLGLQGMPRRVWTYSAEFTSLNMLVTVGAFVVAAAQLLFLWNIVATLRKGAPVGDEVWGGPPMNVAGPTPAESEAEAPQGGAA